MKNWILLVLIFGILSTTACTYIQTADDRRAAERACGVDMLKEPNLEQLYCMEEKGKEYSNYQSLAHKIEEKQKTQKNEFDELLGRCRVTKTQNNKDLISASILAPQTLPTPIIKEKARRFCADEGRDQFRILSIEIVSDPKQTSSKSGTSSSTESYIQKAQVECS